MTTEEGVSIASINDDTTFWSSDEVHCLIEGWARHADEVNMSRNSDVMQRIANHINTNKSATQVRTKLKKMRSLYVTERQRLNSNPGNKSKWRYYTMLNLFGDKIFKHPVRRLGGKASELPSALSERSPRLQMMKIKEKNVMPSAAQLAALIPQVASSAELPPLYPYDPDVPADVAIDTDWSSWNASLQYAMTDSGLRTLLRSGFRDVTHLQLLRRNTADIAFLNLNYHDKLALEHALESGGLKLQQYQVITNDDGTVLEVRGCADADEAILLNDKGLKMAEWNKILMHPLTDAGLVKVIKAGFGTPEDVTGLVNEEAIEDMELSVRDRAAIRKIINPVETSYLAEASDKMDGN